MRHYINEAIRMQQLAGITPLHESTDIKATVDRAIANSFQELSKALKQRKANQEDIDAHDAVKAAVIKVAKEAGIQDAENTPWMEDEIFSGAYSPKEAIQAFREMLQDTLEDTIEYDAGSPLDGQRTEIPISEAGTIYPRIEFEKAVLAAHYQGNLSKEELHSIIDQAI